MTTDRAPQIAALNDLCRKAMGLAGRVYQTRGITALPAEDQCAIREKVETYLAPFRNRATNSTRVEGTARW